MIRNKYILKGIAVTLVILLLNASINPVQLFASNNGPMAPEAMGFEPVDANGMVNPLTGDFSYVLPLLEVPGPAGGYPVTLSYHGGVTMDQEASWVGLGWNINPGAVNRNLQGYPDDWKEKSITTALNIDPLVEENYKLSAGVAYSGLSVGLGFSWGTNKSLTPDLSLGFGIPVGGGSNVGFNYNTSGSISAGVAYAGKISANVGYDFQNSAYTAGVGIKEVGVGASISTSGDYSIGMSVGSFLSTSRAIYQSDALSFGDYSTESYNSNVGLSVPIYGILFSLGYNHSHFRYWLHQNKKRNVYGTLYNSYAPKERPNTYQGLMDKENAMDVYVQAFDPEEDSDEQEAKYPSDLFPNYDSYVVDAQGISGVMSPKYNEPVILTGNSRIINRFESTQNASDEIDYQYIMLGNGNSFTKNFSEIGFEFEGVPNSFLRVKDGTFSTNGITTPIWGYSNNSSTETSLNGISNYDGNSRKLKTSKTVEWFTNSEIISSNTLYQRGFIETKSIKDSYGRQDPENFDPDGIGAYAITDKNGITYHYSLPVYQFEQIFEDQWDNGKKSFAEQNFNKYATSWLLTAITGPDYIDVNNNKELDEEDYGYWVEFDYGKWTDSYFWRSPLTGKETYYDNEGKPRRHFRFGRKQIYYLNTIKTASHTAYFIKDVRVDAQGSKINYVTAEEEQSTVYNAPLNPNWVYCDQSNYGSPDYCGTYNNYDCTYEYTPFNTTEINSNSEHKSLRLDRIVLVDNKRFQPTFTNPSNNLVSDPYSVGSTFTDYQELRNVVVRFNSVDDATYQMYFKGLEHFCAPSIENKFYRHFQYNVLDIKDFTISELADFESKAIKVIKFDQDYSLCQGVPNSTSGKLTLKGFETFGTNKTQLIPGYQFEYDIDLNKTYNLGQKDDWGYWIASKSGVGHNDFLEKPDAGAWSLSQITTPVGGKINIDYESDTYHTEYAMFGANDVKINLLDVNSISVNESSEYVTLSFLENLALDEIFHVGDIVTIGYTGNTYSGNSFPKKEYNKPITVEFQLEVEEVNQTGYDLKLKNVNYSSYDFGFLDSPMTNPDEYINVSWYLVATIEQDEYYGGGVRVKTIDVSDQTGNNYKTEYDYNDLSTNVTSGVTSYAPHKYKNRFIRDINEIPGPGVIYGTCTQKNYGTNNKLLNSTIYTYEVPMEKTSDTEIIPGYYDHVVVQNTLLDQYQSNNHISQIFGYVSRSLISTSKIGRLLNVSNRSANGDIVNKVSYSYYPTSTNSNYNIGDRQETYYHSKRYLQWVDDHTSSFSKYFLSQNSRIKVANILKSVTSNIGGTSTSVIYKNHDINTGQPLTVETTSSLGKSYITKTIPAYKKYLEMGSKVENPSNKNMLSQTTAEFVFSNNENNNSLISATVQTWSNNWNYREYNDAQTRYEYVTSPTDEKVWRKHQNYVYKINPADDGTFNINNLNYYTSFNWANPSSSNANWQKTGEVTHYDHYSRALESKDINGNYAATRMGYDEKYAIAGASNARYTEFGYTGAETQDNNIFFTDGITGVSKISDKYAHTGKYSVRTNFGEEGFKFEGSVGNSSTNEVGYKKYRASVWVHATNYQNAELSYEIRRLDNSLIVSQAINGNNSQAIRAGNWYKLIIDIPLNEYDQNSTDPAGKIIIKTKNSGGPCPQFIGGRPAVCDVYFDDFRFHPIDAGMNSYIYDNLTGQVTAITNTENITTKYEYDKIGRLIKVYQEVPKSDNDFGGFKKVSENLYQYSQGL